MSSNKKMRNFCTLADSEYLVKGLTLYNSLLKTQEEDFRLYFLCLEDSVFKYLSEGEFDKIIPLNISDIESDDFEIKSVKFLQPSVEAISSGSAKNKDPKYIQFCWALAPYLCWRLMLQGLDDIVYIDADLFFYRDFSEIYNEIGDKSVGIIRHRIDYLPNSGEYNVGIVYFKNDYAGRRCSEWWKRMLVTPGNPYYAGYGMCGDQKYLELFEKIFGYENIAVIDENIGHLAPWSVTFHKYENDKIVWEEKHQDLYFFHFAHFVPDFKKDGYRTSYNNEWIWGVPEDTHEFVKLKYDEYYFESKSTFENLLEGKFTNA